MKRIIITIIILCGIGSLYAQQDLIDDVKRLAIINDSLKRAIKSYEQSSNETQLKLQKAQDTISILKSDLSILKNFRDEKETVAKQIKLKSDSITMLKSSLAEKDKELETQKQNFKLKVQEARESGRGELITPKINYYKNTPFDDLIQSSTQKSMQNDKQIIGKIKEVESILSDLDKYFSEKRLLEMKFDAAKIKNAENQLSQIKIESTSLNKLKNTLQNYQAVNEGLKETLGKIMAWDAQESVANGPQYPYSQKLNKIMGEISLYIFNYDFHFLDYPYLSDVVLEVIKRKVPNPDADISNLLQKL